MIKFTKTYVTPGEIENLQDVLKRESLSGDGYYTKLCNQILTEQLNTSNVLLTPSCTSALEMSMILTGISPGDEVIMPSYTFVSTANCVRLRGGIPVFVDIRADTLNINEDLIESAITSRTKAILPVHYAGVSAEMDTIMAIAKKYSLSVIEDAAQGYGSTYKGVALGTIGNYGAISFHSTKNISCGEGGLFVAKDLDVFHNAEIIREKGTNRSMYYRGAVDKYTWVSMGSSYLLSDLNAAVLSSQLAYASEILTKRLSVWRKYQEAFSEIENLGLVRRPQVPNECQHNAHIYYLLINNTSVRDSVINNLSDMNIQATFHYVPLHSSPYGSLNSKIASSLDITDSVSQQILRLPLWHGIDEKVDYIIENVIKSVKKFS